MLRCVSVSLNANEQLWSFNSWFYLTKTHTLKISNTFKLLCSNRSQKKSKMERLHVEATGHFYMVS